jgi:hypothetical protein
VKILPEWKELITKAWSLHFIALAALLSGIEAAFNLVDLTFLPPKLYAFLIVLISSAAYLARLLAQRNLNANKD